MYVECGVIEKKKKFIYKRINCDYIFLNFFLMSQFDLFYTKTTII